MSSTSKRYFGTDGIRGTVGKGVINPLFMLRLGHAVGHALRGTHRTKVVIGKDTRISGDMIEAALEAGLTSAGVDVILTGPLPTPGVAYLTRALRADLGIVISASHNPFFDNGIKFFSAEGKKLPAEWELSIEAAMDEGQTWVTSGEIGKVTHLEGAPARYIEFCKSTFESHLSLKGLKIVVDAAHGAAYHTAHEVFRELGATIECVGCMPDGININDGVGATHPEHIAAETVKHGADFGIALDGDADRIIIADSTGRVYDGDEILCIMTKDRLTDRRTKVDGVVGTVMTNMGIEKTLKDQGVLFHRAQVGDKHIMQMLEHHQWVLGGESSGHVLALDKHTTGDGTIAALQVLQACVRSKKTLPELTADIKKYPQVLINVPLEEGEKFKATDEMYNACKLVEQVLGTDGRFLVRGSGTEPVVRILVEHLDETTALLCANELQQACQGRKTLQ